MLKNHSLETLTAVTDVVKPMGPFWQRQSVNLETYSEKNYPEVKVISFQEPFGSQKQDGVWIFETRLVWQSKVILKTAICCFRRTIRGANHRMVIVCPCI